MFCFVLFIAFLLLGGSSIKNAWINLPAAEEQTPNRKLGSLWSVTFLRSILMTQHYSSESGLPWATFDTSFLSEVLNQIAAFLQCFSLQNAACSNKCSPTITRNKRPIAWSRKVHTLCQCLPLIYANISTRSLTWLEVMGNVTVDTRPATSFVGCFRSCWRGDSRDYKSPPSRVVFQSNHWQWDKFMLAGNLLCRELRVKKADCTLNLKDVS